MTKPDRMRSVRELLVSSGSLRIENRTPALLRELEQYSMAYAAYARRYDHTQDAFAYGVRLVRERDARERAHRLIVVLRWLFVVLGCDFAVIASNFYALTHGGARWWNVILAAIAVMVAIGALVRVRGVARELRDA